MLRRGIDSQGLPTLGIKEMMVKINAPQTTTPRVFIE